MFTQKLFKTGNSVVVTIPKQLLDDLKLKDGQEVTLAGDNLDQTIIISGKTKKKVPLGITPEFLKWLDSFNSKYGPALKELARK